MSIDGRVSGLNRPVFEALQKVKNPKAMTPDEAKSLRSAVMQDNRIDPAEQDLLRELTQDSNRTVQISAQPSAGFNPQALGVDTAKGLSRDKLALLANPPNMHALWDGGAEGVRKLVDMATVSPALNERVAQFMSVKLEAAWEASNFMNAYAPMVAAVGGTYNAVRSNPESNEPGRELLLKSIEKVNQRLEASNKAPIQPFLYNWIRPGGYL